MMYDPSMAFYRLQMFMLVYDLHRLGISHGDLESRNVVRTDDGKFLLMRPLTSREAGSIGAKNVSHNMYVSWRYIESLY